SAAAAGTGSHIDAIPHSGRFDGTVGVVGGLESIRALQRRGFKPRRSIELLAFISEEPTRFGVGCLGSRMLSGALAPDDAALLKDREGQLLDTVRSNAHFIGPLTAVKLQPDYYSSFVELHIEQGPILERENIPLGVVTSIAAPAAVRVLIEGEGGHAGAVLMPQRRDAFLGAAEIALAVEAAVRATNAIDTVGTCGLVDVFPGLANSIPSRVKLELDVRDTDPVRRDSVLQKISQDCQSIAARRNLQISSTTLNADAPATCDPVVLAALESACSVEGFAYKAMVSRAYHDSLFMSRIAPTAMLFIPCKAGVSHRPDEYAAPDDLANGARVLARALATLAS
ncbi:MAG TPA: M20 family metallo-hydrolase, partial [Lacipirellulaceae bacterium]|nr:M20 family metallo-hydrolase [Lacipirellulaceae bacterium]